MRTTALLIAAACFVACSKNEPEKTKEESKASSAPRPALHYYVIGAG